MGIQSLQHFLEAQEKSQKKVDLVRLASEARKEPSRSSKGFRLVLDAESCLDRLYGGFTSDWISGGQWNRTFQFLSSLQKTCHANDIRLHFVFNGALEITRMRQWTTRQLIARDKIQRTFRQATQRGTPPPKLWWVPPVGLRMTLLLALRYLGVEVCVAMDDHHQEAIAYCRENECEGLIADDGDYAVFSPPKYFSARKLKLTFRGTIETAQYYMDDLAKSVDLHPNRFCLMAALLGNHILAEEELHGFYHHLLKTDPRSLDSRSILTAVINFVRRIEKADDLNSVAEVVFLSCSSANEREQYQDKLRRLKQSVQYYTNGTHDGFLNYRLKGGDDAPGSYEGARYRNGHDAGGGQNGGHFASDAEERKVEEAPRPVDSKTICHSDVDDDDDNDDDRSSRDLTNHHPFDAIDEIRTSMAAMSVDKKTKSDAGSYPENSTSLSSGLSISSQIPSTARPQIPDPLPSRSSTNVPFLPREILRVASQRHLKGYMCPWIYQVINHGEIKLDVCFEDENEVTSSCDLPSALDLFREARQNVYGILFNAKEKQIGRGRLCQAQLDNSLVVKEWYVNRGNMGERADEVPVRTLDWAVPPLQHLWMGTALEDKPKRVRAFLSCLNSESLKAVNIPPHLLMLCCVLRYMLSYSNLTRPFLRRYELDAFLATAVSPLLTNVDFTQDMQLPIMDTRSMMLASIFMRGLEIAMFANDACGAPIPWQHTLPWTFFDGKIFHHKMLRSIHNKPLLEICDGQMDQVVKVERLREALIAGTKFGFAQTKMLYPSLGDADQNFSPGPHPTPVQQSAGGQLQIAGVVVGNWGGSARGSRGAPITQIHSVVPRDTFVGGRPRGVTAPPRGPLRGAMNLNQARGAVARNQHRRREDFYEDFDSNNFSANFPFRVGGIAGPGYGAGQIYGQNYAQNFGQNYRQNYGQNFGNPYNFNSLTAVQSRSKHYQNFSLRGRGSSRGLRGSSKGRALGGVGPGRGQRALLGGGRMETTVMGRGTILKSRSEEDERLEGETKANQSWSVEMEKEIDQMC